MSINIGLLIITNTAYLCKMLTMEELKVIYMGNSSLSLQLSYKPKTPKNKIYFKNQRSVNLNFLQLMVLGIQYLDWSLVQVLVIANVITVIEEIGGDSPWFFRMACVSFCSRLTLQGCLQQTRLECFPLQGRGKICQRSSFEQ